MKTDQIVNELNRMHIEQAKLFSRAAKMLESGGESGVLLWLREQKQDVFAVDIIEHFDLTPGRVANIVRKLEERGYLRREQNGDDLRKTILRLSESGCAYADELFAQMNADHIKAVRVLGEEEASHLLHIFRHLPELFQ